MGRVMDQAVATTLETLEPLLAKVAEVHGRQDPRLVAVALEFSFVRARLEKEPLDLAAAAADLERLADLTDGFAPPEHACRSYRRALADLEWLRRRLTSHDPHTPPPDRGTERDDEHDLA
jgi:iron-sulfur cluster repair protein YtfE (RIC family)